MDAFCLPGDQLQQLPEILDVQQVDPDAAAGARERPSEAPERLRADKYQGGGTQGGKEATWRAAAGSAAWIRDQLPEILRRIRMRYQVISCSSCRRSWMCSRWIRMQLPGLYTDGGKDVDKKRTK